ncbi:hypothetical protein Trydic_g22878 [Trypoxylus dichotomus]
MDESFPANWDIEYYREDAEPDEHWELRKTFMEVHKNKFPEEYLVALSKAFANVEFLGCLYPIRLMDKIAEMSKIIAKKYRAGKAMRLQRTFITASKAAKHKITVPARQCDAKRTPRI